MLFRPMSQMHESHGGHDAINVRLTGGRNLQEGNPHCNIIFLRNPPSSIHKPI
jgi:hypothetical protein